MRQLTTSFVSAMVLATVLVTTVAADSHTAPAATGATGTTVTAVPRAGVGTIELATSGGVILLLVVLAGLLALASVWNLRRA